MNPKNLEALAYRAMDYRSGKTLDGIPSPELIRASLDAGDVGAVPARRVDGVWIHVPEGLSSETIPVYVEARGES